MTKLDQAIEKILTENVEGDPWTELCVETVRFSHALCRWDQAIKRYKKTKEKENEG